LQLVAWALLCSQLSGPARTPQPPGQAGRLRCSLGTALGMLLAATLAAQSTEWMARWPLAAALLLAAALVPASGGRNALHRLDLPMGLMMGSLLPMAQWCASQGWNASTVVGLHLAAMAAGVAAGALLRPGPLTGRLAWATAAALCLLPPAAAMLAAAGLLAWASARPGPAQARSAAWTGSLLLLLVGELGSTWGPDALRLALVPALLLAALWPQGSRKAAWA